MTRIPVRFLDTDLGAACRLSEVERLSEFVRDEDSEVLKLFHPDQKNHCSTGDWYGEHAGKWLAAAGLTYWSNNSEDLRAQIEQVVSYLGVQQEESGYLGTYAKDSNSRMTNECAENARTWDIWIHSWLLLGLLEVVDIPGCGQSETITKRIGELVLLEFGSGRRPVDQGNHAGLSSLVIIEPLALMAKKWDDSRYSDLALAFFNQAVDSGLDFWGATDVSQIGTGKSYQLLWCLKGLLELGQVLDREDLVGIVAKHWANVRDFHLTPMGGPWGGIATHKEVFNPPDFFDPCGLVETCSSVTWMMLSHRLFEVTGDSSYLAEVEKTLFNSVLGAIDENGKDWCYFTFPNGRRNNTYHWACCKSSGALGLAYAASAVVAEKDGICSILSLESCEFETPDGASVRVIVGADSVSIMSSGTLNLAIYVSPSFEMVDVPEEAVREGDWLCFGVLPDVLTEIGIKRKFQVELKTHFVDHHGQEIVREEYVCVKLGRDVFATGKFEGYRTQETLRMPRLAPESVFKVIGESEVELRQAGRDPILMVPYWRCGGRHEGAWRTTWLQVAWQ
ncbi:MAG: beta-L-arabinofuranosidase domain-containing protein [Fimbriimonadaceae bacterium]